MEAKSRMNIYQADAEVATTPSSKRGVSFVSTTKSGRNPLTEHNHQETPMNSLRKSLKDSSNGKQQQQQQQQRQMCLVFVSIIDLGETRVADKYNGCVRDSQRRGQQEYHSFGVERRRAVASPTCNAATCVRRSTGTRVLSLRRSTWAW
jgi:hypothetical protein